MSFSYRVKFTRKGPASYIGHLDMLRYFQKAISRSGIKIKYSEGFNPHQIISFAYPLGVSMETEGDYFDMELTEEMDENLIKDTLNSVLNDGITVKEARKIPEKALNSMAAVELADYDIRLDCMESFTEELIALVLDREEINIEKDGKEGGKKVIKTVNIREGIYALERRSDSLFMKLSSGSSFNIKPSMVIDSINKITGNSFKIEKITRLELYRKNKKGNFVPLGCFDD